MKIVAADNEQFCRTCLLCAVNSENQVGVFDTVFYCPLFESGVVQNKISVFLAY